MTIEGEAEIRRKEAAEWFTRLNQRRVTTEDVKQFSAWRRNPHNERAFSRLEAMWEAAGTLAENPEMVAITQSAASRLDERKMRARRLANRLVPIGIVSAIIIAIGAGSSVWFLQRPIAYTTSVGERRTVRLQDGSQIILDTNSRVTVRFTDSRRVVTLATGQAMFHVQGDPERPFFVTAGDTEVTALGTQFDVRRSGTGARIILVEGQVAVRKAEIPDASWTLTPGQQVTTSSRRPEVMAANVPAATSWTLGRLTFENTPIAVAVAEVNRYSREPIELRDERISTIRVNGAFNVGDVEGFVAALSDLYALDVIRSADGQFILTGPA